MKAVKKAYIYKITNTIDKKAYIGITGHAKPIKRFKKHILISRNKELYLKNGNFGLLHQAILDFGESAFSFEVLEQCTVKSGWRREKHWIKVHNTFGENGYNKTAGGRGFNGRTHSAETKDKLSDINKGKFAGEKNGWFGHHHTEEAKAKISAGNKKPIFNRGKNNPFYGKKHTEETIEVMREKASNREYKKEWVIKRSKLSTEDVKDIKKAYSEGARVVELAEKYEVSIPCIYKVLKKPRQIDQEQES